MRNLVIRAWSDHRVRTSLLLCLTLSIAACDSTPDAESPQTSSTASSSTGPSSSNTAATSASTTSNVASSSASSSASSKPVTDVNDKPLANAKSFAKSSNAFGLDLYGKLRSEKGNLAMSPASVTVALAMTWAGARGKTADEMKTVLHFEGSSAEVSRGAGELTKYLTSSERPITLRIANQLFGEKTFKFEQPFLDSTKAAFGAPLEPVDFANSPEPSRVAINGWVDKTTEHRIKDLVPKSAIDSDTRLVLVNAVYFLAEWKDPFEKTGTVDQEFSVTKSSKKKVPTMHRTSTMRYAEGGGAKLVELPYKGDSTSMLVLLPDDVDGLAALEEKLTSEKLDEMIGKLSSERVELALPKFEVAAAQPFALSKTLKSMGMLLAFDRGNADFTAIANPPDPKDRLYISNVFHKAFVKADEKGTEAAAATAVVMARGGAAKMNAKAFYADHPFLFFLRDNETGAILFMGRVADPSVTS